MPTITTKPITAANWSAALELTLHPHQRAFVPTVALSLAKAYIQPNGFCYDPYGIYLHTWRGNQVIGFYSFIHLPDDPTFAYIGGFFIDERFQGRGYGRAALQTIVGDLRTNRPLCKALLLSVHPNNVVATRLYEALGFVKTGQWLEGEAEMKLVVNEAEPVEAK